MRSERSAPAVVATLLALALALAAALSGCGIRPTSVPVDAGVAPSRLSCAVPSPAAPATPTGTARPTPAAGAGQRRVPVYLVCSGEVMALPRSLPKDVAVDRLATARALLRELRTKPGDEETAAGFGTDVPGDLDLSGPRTGDPATTLRLSDGQGQLPSFSLAQIVCTFARSAAAGTPDGTVVLGFADDHTPRRFTCTSGLRTRQEAAETAGTAVR